MAWLAGAIVIAAGVWLVGLAVAILLCREATAAFIRRFASSARAHYTEQMLRLVVGGALILYADQMRHVRLFQIFGGLLVVTAAVLMIMPWKWHQRFGERVIPWIIQYLGLYALAALGLGLFVLYAAI